ncbi:hypothetical protein L6452_06075 [Arctium lappa]|uniref:Uncharacterized protein n=1 Tax=Arctium lappa TaxID=4217 RepID=A0ACB9EIL7_ARCLA|nr:hypothetical protein L6452_06075 [Arctium lappa]
MQPQSTPVIGTIKEDAATMPPSIDSAHQTIAHGGTSTHHADGSTDHHAVGPSVRAVCAVPHAVGPSVSAAPYALPHAVHFATHAAWTMDHHTVGPSIAPPQINPPIKPPPPLTFSVASKLHSSTTKHPPFTSVHGVAHQISAPPPTISSPNTPLYLLATIGETLTNPQPPSPINFSTTIHQPTNHCYPTKEGSTSNQSSTEPSPITHSVVHKPRTDSHHG